MKVLALGLVIFASTILVSAQETPRPVEAAKVIAELAAARPASAIKNSPFAAEEQNESVQTLADGNRIVRSSTGKIYRNSEGRVRREIAGGIGGIGGSTYTLGQGISIMDPIGRQKVLLDSALKTAQVVEMNSGQNIAIAKERAATDEEKAKLESKLTTLRATAPVLITGQGNGPVSVVSSAQGGFTYSTGSQITKYESRTEDLGLRDFDGVSAKGTRRVTTIPAGAIGNERPIEITYERWFSDDLGMVVYSRNSDPRFGEQTYKLTNIVRTEPDPSLFSVPVGYKTVTSPNVYKAAAEAGAVYRISATKAEAEKAAAKAVTYSSPSKPKP